MNYKLRIQREIKCQKKSKEHWETRLEELSQLGSCLDISSPIHPYSKYAKDCEIQTDIHHYALRLLESLIR